MKKPLIASDIDGVVVDWMNPFIQHINTHFGYSLRYEDCHTHTLMDLLQVDFEELVKICADFEQKVPFHHHPFMEEGYQGLQSLQEDFEIIFITSRPHSYEAYTRQMIQEHFGVEVIFAHGAQMQYGTQTGRKKKWQLADELGALYLIEDNPYEFDGWQASTKPICHKQPWNSYLPQVHPDIPHTTWPEIVDIIRKTYQKGGVMES